MTTTIIASIITTTGQYDDVREGCTKRRWKDFKFKPYPGKRDEDVLSLIRNWFPFQSMPVDSEGFGKAILCTLSGWSCMHSRCDEGCRHGEERVSSAPYSQSSSPSKQRPGSGRTRLQVRPASIGSPSHNPVWSKATEALSTERT